MNPGTGQSNGPGIQQGGLNVGPQPNSSGPIPPQYQAVYAQLFSPLLEGPLKNTAIRARTHQSNSEPDNGWFLFWPVP